jgi:hypothetical protein
VWSRIPCIFPGNRGTCKFLPIIDGDFIPTLPSQAITEGRFAKVRSHRLQSRYIMAGVYPLLFSDPFQVPFIGGHTTNDGSIFVNQPSAITDDAQVVASITKRYTYLVSLLFSLLPSRSSFRFD